MAKFLSNDRKVILKSAAAGVGIISLLSLVLLTESMLLWGIAFFGVLAVYWCIPTWLSRERQLDVKEVKNFNADGKEVRKLSDREKITAFVLFLTISAFLIFFGYDMPVKFFLAHYPSFKVMIIGSAAVTSFSTPYLMRHIYCFVLNRPMDTSFKIEWNGSSNNVPYIHKYDDSWSQNTATSPRYSNLSYNIYHHHHR